MHMQPFIDSVKDRAKEPALNHTILALLHLIEDTSDFIINSMPQPGAGEGKLRQNDLPRSCITVSLIHVGRTVRGFTGLARSDRINELLQRLGDLKENFDRGIGVQTLKQALSAGKPFDSIPMVHTQVTYISC